ncbi:CCN_G0032500.mRNA.1.CDS.1 [Saccharomyces cerevisiae]|nr:HLJ1_G0004110.mRNA.1.CDS.1 [Saccharomyces cerevisiae]CAI4590162.1 CCN_G0032500.mRNA.1.CDS.1 [Saccharomyces cerevisiae]CAI7379610.1 CCN_G0032500.mRNA.1.CDS.1 [Saccharomyces cerevisiae]
MYIPKHFESMELSRYKLSKKPPLGTLFSSKASRQGFFGWRTSSKKDDPDFARKNKQVEMLERVQKCLVVFQSVDSYISPAWYPMKKRTHKFVPTWDFAAVYKKKQKKQTDMGSSTGFHHADHVNYSSNLNKEEILEQLLLSYEGLSDGQVNWVCNLSNASSLIWHAYKSLGVDINWAGFYVTQASEENTLILGPFQGKVACQMIQFGKGVCGTAASTKETQIVPDVNKYPGHIACDGETKSEIVVPIISNDGKTLGVIDIDCLDYEGFDHVDKEFLEKLAKLINKSCVFK